MDQHATVAASSGIRESVIVIDHNGLILRFDAGAEHTFGYASDEVIGRNVRLLMPEPYRSAHDRYLADYLRTGEAHIIGTGRKITATRRDGSDFPAQLSVTEIEIHGSPAFAGILRDVTAQDSADAESHARELALDTASASLVELSNQRADAEVRYRLLAENAVDIIGHLQGNKVLWISPSVEAAFGWPPEQWLGADFSHHVHPGDRDALAAGVHAVARGEPAAVRCRIATADDSYRWVDIRGKPYIDAEGNADGIVFASRLIDDQVKAEEQLRTYRERFEAIVGSTPSAISVRDLEHRFTMVNEAFCQLFGQNSAEDVIGRTENEVLPADVLDRSHIGAVRTLAGESFVEEEEIRRGSASIAVLTQRFPLRESGGVITELVTIRTDITHRKRIERDAAERATWEERIGAAISDGRLMVYSQPIVDITTREAVAEELLVRLRDVETNEILSPSEFLPQCERHELMPAIDRYMIGQAIALARAGRHVCVNITGQTIGDAMAMGEILQTLTTAGPEITSKILVEITESTALASPEIAKTFSLNMRNLGCRVALDDFGTGYGAFTELRHLDLDSLKIDISFVQNMLEEPGDERAVSTILLVARIYGLLTVAEGVETETVLERLAELGVDRAQGYLFGEPQQIDWHGI
ncbi:hypothetical protein NGTWS0302_09370 [Mycolicibacterium cyprinidarum]|uniref:EAL domain-containing protein n=1 Tax=Mycolicibacterium cyprinidarum TaxID=2860311 RepID=A0ABQ4VAI4_9MYCO|nr:hypothetical protein NGTWS1702_02840 [Mycolicibacterium sp. NGTWSNA01]GJF15495.1 hypothetical protein NGTWS0302_09370 [Mycolicibacterium sp. NGTWS0302]